MKLISVGQSAGFNFKYAFYVILLLPLLLYAFIPSIRPILAPITGILDAYAKESIAFLFLLPALVVLIPLILGSAFFLLRSFIKDKTVIIGIQRFAANFISLSFSCIMSRLFPFLAIVVALSFILPLFGFIKLDDQATINTLRIVAFIFILLLVDYVSTLRDKKFNVVDPEFLSSGILIKTEKSRLNPGEKLEGTITLQLSKPIFAEKLELGFVCRDVAKSGKAGKLFESVQTLSGRKNYQNQETFTFLFEVPKNASTTTDAKIAIFKSVKWFLKARMVLPIDALLPFELLEEKEIVMAGP